MRWKLAFLALLTLLGPASAQQQGTVVVYNYTDKPIYVVLDGRNQGEVWAGSYQSYPVPIGDHKIEAYQGERFARHYLRLTASYPDGETTFCGQDF